MLQASTSSHSSGLDRLDLYKDINKRLKPQRHRPVINYDHSRQALSVLTVLKLPLCKYILTQLGQHAGGLSVIDITKLAHFDLPTNTQQSFISHHLIRLRKHGIVTYTKDGKYHIYVANHIRISSIASALERFFTQ